MGAVFGEGRHAVVGLLLWMLAGCAPDATCTPTGEEVCGGGDEDDEEWGSPFR